MKTVELAKQLIAHDTTSPVKDPAVFNFLKGMLEAEGIDTALHERNGVYNLTAETGDGPTRVCLNGHVDVVPPGDGWEVTTPFDPVVVDGKLYGRGAADMKGGLAAQIAAFIDLHTDPEFDGTAVLMVAGDEEVGGMNGSGPLVHALPSFDYAIVGEPTDMDIQVATRGVLWVNVYLDGESVHASRPHLAENVTRRLPAVLTALHELDLSFEPDDMLPDPTWEVTVVETDGPQNSLPGRVRVGMDIRYLPTQTVDTIIDEITTAVTDAGAVSFHIEYTDHGGAFKLTDETFKHVATDVLTTVRGEEPAHITSGGASDGRFFAKQGTPFIELGPNQEPGHQADEWCRIDHLEQLRDAYSEITKRLAAAN